MNEENDHENSRKDSNICITTFHMSPYINITQF